VRDRLVEPFDFTTNYVSVWVFDPESRTNKIFKTVRIKSVEILNKPRLHTGLHEKLPLDIFRISGSEKIPVKLKLNIRAYNLLIEEYPLSSEFISQINDNTWQYEGCVVNYDGVARFILGLCEDVEIAALRGLKDFIIEKIKCLTK